MLILYELRLVGVGALGALERQLSAREYLASHQ